MEAGVNQLLRIEESQPLPTEGRGGKLHIHPHSVGALAKLQPGGTEFKLRLTVPLGSPNMGKTYVLHTGKVRSQSQGCPTGGI